MMTVVETSGCNEILKFVIGEKPDLKIEIEIDIEALQA